MSHYAARERQDLADLLDEVGPDEPTLCEGWRTADLAAHLVIREHRPDAALGMVAPALAGYTDRVQRHERDRRPWTELVAAVRNGPPLPLRPLDETINTLEYFVHHEDVRRAQADWAPRDLDAGEELALWRRLKPVLRVATRKAPDRIALQSPGQDTMTAGKGGTTVTVAGPPGEIALFVFGRSSVARVDLSGDPAAVDRLRAAGLGL